MWMQTGHDSTTWHASYSFHKYDLRHSHQIKIPINNTPGVSIQPGPRPIIINHAVNVWSKRSHVNISDKSKTIISVFLAESGHRLAFLVYYMHQVAWILHLCTEFHKKLLLFTVWTFQLYTSYISISFWWCYHSDSDNDRRIGVQNKEDSTAWPAQHSLVSIAF